jgi:ATP-dependent helicase/nuclease subunit B
LVKEKNYRYRDIAVIASDIDSYQHYVTACFNDYGIPFFIDKRKPLNQHPVVQLICSALQVVTGGFSHGDIFACLKTDLVPVPRFDIDLLENYCLAFGITGGDWLQCKKWSFTGRGNEDFDEQRINRIRLKTVEPLLKLRDSLCPAENQSKMLTPDEFTRAVFSFLNELKVKETIGGWIEQAEKNKDSATIDEHQQFYNKLVDVFDELVEVFAGQTMPADDFFAIIDSAFSQLTLAFIPPTLDQVLVGSIERSRHPDLKAVFLIGATQRQFPVPLASDSILTEDDRSAAESAGFQLAPALSQTLTDRKYLAYIAFTRPSEFLCVTYPLVDEKGGAVPRSLFIDNLESLFENLNEKSIANEQTKLEKVHGKTELMDMLCTQLGRDTFKSETRDNKITDELLEDICSHEMFAELGSNIRYAINYDNRASLEASVVGKLLDRRIQSSATRLSTFAACPYQYFARYTLQLEQRKEFKFEPLDLGDFYHKVLDALLKALNEKKRDFATIENQQLLETLEEQTEQVIQANSFFSNFRRRSPHNAYIISAASEILEDCVSAIAQMVRAGDFRPALSEVSFGRAEGARETIGDYELALPDNHMLSLNGKIDRLDIANVHGENVALVFDYKRSKSGATFNWSEFFHGLALQLPLYLLAVRNATASKIRNVAGAFYIPVEVSPEKTALDEIPKKTDKFAYKANGIFNGKFARQIDGKASKDSKFYNFYVTKDGQPYGLYHSRGILKPVDFEKVLKFTEKKIIDMAGKILSGHIDVRPYRLSGKSPCSYCKYLSVCRFDWQINDYNPLIPLGKKRILEMMEISDG